MSDQGTPKPTPVGTPAPALTLTKTRMKEGVWEGLLKRAGEVPEGAPAPAIEVIQDTKALPGVEVADTQASGWAVRVPIPMDLISDGVTTFVIRDKATGEKLSSFALLAGEAFDDDLRAEIDLLRAELDMLKRAFRRHCLETM